MGSSKAREREYERRRYAKSVARYSKAVQRRRRNRFVAFIVAGVMVVGVGVTWAVLSTRDSADQTADTFPTDGSTDLPPVASTDVLDQTTTATTTLTLSSGTLSAPGTLTVDLFGDAAPEATSRFLNLVGSGFYNGLTCHRLVESADPGFHVLQCGDPNGDGTGGPGYSFGPIENAPSDDQYPAGTLAMARQGGDGNSMGSQFFIVYGESSIPSDAAGGYTVFGKVTSGLDLVAQIAAAGNADDGERPINTVTIDKVETP